MKTIFHVGHAKTGSTTVQAVFLASQGTLRSKGVLYPSNPNGLYNNHKLLSTDLMDPSRIPRHVSKNYRPEDLPAAAQELVDGIGAEITEWRPDCLMLSSETRFGTLNKEGRAAFRNRLLMMGSEDIDIVAYIRRPASWYLSALNQRMRRAVRIKAPRVLNLRGSLRQFEEDFGRDHLKLRVFDRDALVGGDIVEDFCTAFLAPYGVTVSDLDRAHRDNASISNETLDVVQRYRARFLADQDDKFVLEGEDLLCVATAAEQGVTLPKPRLRPEIAEQVDYGGKHILWLRDTYGVELPGYDYDHAARGQIPLPPLDLRLDDIIEIDRAAQAQVIAQIADSDWAQSSEVRRAWFRELTTQIATEIGISVVHPIFGSATVTSTKTDQSDGDITMTDANISGSDTEAETERNIAKSIGRAIFRTAHIDKNASAESRREAWKADRKAYVKQGRRVLKQLRKDGFKISMEEA